MENLDVDVLRL